MLSIENIKSDKYDSIFDHFISWALLLYQLDEVSPVIPVPNADLMSFIQVFDNVIECQNRIRNSQKLVTLFAYDKNMYQWLTSNTDIPNNLKYMNIFCNPEDWFFLTGWAGNYIDRLKNTVFHIITSEHLNHKLLSFGAKYLRELRKQFQNDLDTWNSLDQHYKDICETLENRASQKANIEDERVRQSEEAQN
jgi:hypothetical protein